MAIAHVHGDKNADLNAPGATFTVSMPIGGASTEICILVVTSSRSSGTPVGTWSAPAGWTPIFTAFMQDQTVGTLGIQAWWSLADNTNLTFTKSGTVNFAGWVSADFSGVDLTTPIDVAGTGQGNAGANNLSVASITIATNQAMDIIVGADWQSGGTFTITNFTVSVNGNTNQSAVLCYNTTLKSTGATGTATFNNTASAAGQALAAARFALRPAAAPGTYTATAAVTTPHVTFASAALGTSPPPPPPPVTSSQLGLFDPELVPAAWFDPELVPAAWFDPEWVGDLGPAAFTATMAKSVAARSFAATATFTPPVYTATMAKSVAARTFASSGTVVNPTYTATMAKSVAARSFVSSATFRPTFTATMSKSVAARTFTSSATFVAPVYHGTMAKTLGQRSFSASGTFSAPVYHGSASLTTGNRNFTASGTVTSPVYHGSMAFTVHSPTFAASGVTTVPVYTATLSKVVSARTFTASGATTGPKSTATAPLTARQRLFAATGTFVAPVYHATSVLVAPGADFAASAIFAAVVRTASMAKTVAARSFASSGTFTAPVYHGTMAKSVGQRSFAASGAVAAPVYHGTAALVAPTGKGNASALWIPDIVYSATATLTTGPVQFAAAVTFVAGSGGTVEGLIQFEPIVTGELLFEPLLVTAGQLDMYPTVSGQLDLTVTPS